MNLSNSKNLLFVQATGLLLFIHQIIITGIHELTPLGTIAEKVSKKSRARPLSHPSRFMI
jgi:hypothetical protein